jgi:hypothetical protein
MAPLARMTAYDETTTAAPPRSVRGRLRALAHRTLMRFAKPYARWRAREADTAGRLARLEREFDHARRRHSEQIERLEDLVCELVLAVEALRRSGGDAAATELDSGAARLAERADDG